MHDCRAAIAFSYAEKIGRCIPNAAYLHFSILNLYKDQKKKKRFFYCRTGYDLQLEINQDLNFCVTKASPAEDLLQTRTAFQGWPLYVLRQDSQVLRFSGHISCFSFPFVQSSPTLFTRTALILQTKSLPYVDTGTQTGCVLKGHTIILFSY